jgi:cell division protein FtsB
MFVPLILTTHLIVYHLWLMKHNITTFDHITFKRARQMQQEQLKLGLIGK